MGVVADTVDPSEGTPVNIGAVNATAVNIGNPSIPVTIFGVQLNPLTAVNVPGVGSVAQFETVASAAAMALKPSVAYHWVTGVTGITTMTGGVEGQLAYLFFASTPLITTAADLTTANRIHVNSYNTTVAPANFQPAATAGLSCVKCFLFTSQLPGMTSGTGQWFEL